MAEGDVPGLYPTPGEKSDPPEGEPFWPRATTASDTPDDRNAAKFADVAEARRQGNVALTWAVPSLALTAQAFLLQTAFNSAVSQTGRVFALSFGLAFASAALMIFVTHLRVMMTYERVLDRVVGYRVSTTFDRWAAGGGSHPRLYGLLERAGRSAGFFWTVALLGTVLADVALIVITIWYPTILVDPRQVAQ